MIYLCVYRVCFEYGEFIMCKMCGYLEEIQVDWGRVQRGKGGFFNWVGDQMAECGRSNIALAQLGGRGRSHLGREHHWGRAHGNLVSARLGKTVCGRRKTTR